MIGRRSHHRDLLAEARAADARGDLRVASALALEAGEAAHQLHDGPAVIDAALVTWGVPDPATAAATERLCELALGDAGSDPLTQARLHAQLAVALHHRGRLEQSAEEVARAVRFADASGAPIARAAALDAQLLSIAGVDRGPGLHAASDQMLEAAQLAGSTAAELAARVWRVDSLMRTGATVEAAHELDALDVLAVRSASPLVSWNALLARAGLNHATGAFAEAERRARQAREALPVAQRPQTEPLFIAQLMLIATDTGTTPDEMAIVRRFAAADQVIASVMVARFDLEMGDEMRAVAAFEAVRQQLAQLPVDRRRLPTLLAAAELAVAAGDMDMAAGLSGRLRAFSGAMIISPLGAVGPVDATLAVVTAALGDLDDAITHADAAVDVAARGGFWPWLARARLLDAELRVRRGLPADRARVRQLVGAALAGAQDLGMRMVADRAGELSDRIARGAVLSTREREIAGLVAAGATNRQIAAQLFISDRTVESHVERILDKLGYRSRTQIAGWIADERRTDLGRRGVRPDPPERPIP